jgi:hypothetical protein
VWFPAIDRQEKTDNQTGDDSHHAAVFTMSAEGLEVEVLFPPAEEVFHLPTEFIN